MSFPENIPSEIFRTLGDGMDSQTLSKESTKTEFNLKINLKPQANILKSFQPVTPHSKVHYLVPKYIPNERKPKYLLKKPKEPKFVPYEPYKGAVEPIIPPKPLIRIKPSKNNIEIQQLVTQLTEFRKSEMAKVNKTAFENNETLLPKEVWQKEKNAYETDIKNLRETNVHLENQLKFQAQVNGELKTLLVAAVGEDLETRVQHLTEDKLQLARALLNSANHLTSHQEQTEWLSGQCEVWRSKFLASSLMVEELAGWKAALSRRIMEFQDVSKTLLEENDKLFKNQHAVLQDLRKICSKLNINDHINVTNVNNLNLSKINEDLVKNIGNKLEISDDSLQFVQKQYTRGENGAIKLLQDPVSLVNKQEAVCNAVLGVATSLCNKQVPHTGCCSHCKGEMQNI